MKSIFSVAAVAAAIGALLAPAPPARRRPNVVVVLIDTLRADHLPIYGYPRDTAPFLARLAAKSVVFSAAQSTSAWTAPATASLFTSLYPFQHHVDTGFMVTKQMREIGQEIRIAGGQASTILDPATAETLRSLGYVH